MALQEILEDLKQPEARSRAVQERAASAEDRGEAFKLHHEKLCCKLLEEDLQLHILCATDGLKNCGPACTHGVIVHSISAAVLTRRRAAALVLCRFARARRRRRGDRAGLVAVSLAHPLSQLPSSGAQLSSIGDASAQLQAKLAQNVALLEQNSPSKVKNKVLIDGETYVKTGPPSTSNSSD